MDIAHRGLWNHQNRVEGIVRVSSLVEAVEVDVRVNSKGVIVLCHDKDKVDDDNDTLEELCKVSEKLRIILELKENIAQKVLKAISGSNHAWELCSYDYRCVDELCRTSGYKVGLITTGAPHPKALGNIDFISQDYEFFDSEILKMYKERNLDVYIFGTNKNICGVDGIIKNIFLDISK